MSQDCYLRRDDAGEFYVKHEYGYTIPVRLKRQSETHIDMLLEGFQRLESVNPWAVVYDAETFGLSPLDVYIEHTCPPKYT